MLSVVVMEVFAKGTVLLLKPTTWFAITGVNKSNGKGWCLGGTSLSESRMSRLTPASMKSCEEALTVASIAFE